MFFHWPSGHGKLVEKLRLVVFEIRTWSRATEPLFSKDIEPPKTSLTERSGTSMSESIESYSMVVDWYIKNCGSVDVR